VAGAATLVLERAGRCTEGKETRSCDGDPGNRKQPQYLILVNILG
jgi:hypothetical protein